MNITVEFAVDLSKLNGKLNQIPFATALALTRTAQDAQAEVRRGLRPGASNFVIRNDFVAKGILFTAAKKDTLQAAVFSRDDFMVKQEKGGTKTPRGSNVAIPIDVRTNKRGIVTQANRPRQILNKPDVFVARMGGLLGVWQRLGKRAAKKSGRALKLLYVFKPSVPIRARFGFADTVRRVVTERFARQMGLAIERALRTAR